MKLNHSSLSLHAVSAFQDNYIWVLTYDNEAIIVDPGEADPIITFLTASALTPVAILLTHNHDDHIGGVAHLRQHYPDLAVYGPCEVAQCLTSEKIEIITEASAPIQIGSLRFQVIDVPGHTLGHIAYYCAPYLFCGDTLFSGGCGRIVPNGAKMMYQSLQTLAALPDDTLVCCAHEYTVNNLKFAQQLLPDHQAISTALQHAEAQRQAGACTLPSTIKKEKAINVFLDCDNPSIKELFGQALNSWQRFAALRMKKDDF